MQSPEELYQQTIDQVFGYVFLRVRNRQAAEDIVSEAYLKAVEHFNDYKPRAHASRRSWLFAIVRNTMIDAHRRKHATDVELPDGLSGTTERDVQEGIDVLRQHEQALKHMDALPDRQREILMLRYKGELKNKEIAELLEIDERTVSATLSKGIATLRTHLTKHETYV